MKLYLAQAIKVMAHLEYLLGKVIKRNIGSEHIVWRLAVVPNINKWPADFLKTIAYGNLNCYVFRHPAVLEYNVVIILDKHELFNNGNLAYVLLENLPNYGIEVNLKEILKGEEQAPTPGHDPLPPQDS